MITALKAKSRGLSVSSAGDSTWMQLFAGIAALMGVVLLVSVYAVLPQLEVFGHDEVHYYADLSFKLGEDGRWLNFFLHDFLRAIAPGIWAVLFLGASWAVLFRTAQALGVNSAYAVLVASVILMSAPFVEQSLWPATTFPAIVVLLLAKFLADRKVPFALVYVIGGVLSFGTVQSFYFMLPLFFLSQFMTAHGRERVSWQLLAMHMIWWVAGAIAGVLVMSSMLWFLTGHFGVQPAEWRATQPLHDFAGLVRNLHYVLNVFRIQLIAMAQQVGDGIIWVLFAVIITGVLRVRSLINTLPALLLLAAVAASFYAFSTPLAPVIQTRSLVALAAAVVLFCAVLPGSSLPGRLLGSIVLLVIGFGFSRSGQAYLQQHQEQTVFLYEKLQQVMPGYPRSYAAVALFGTMEAEAPEATIFNDTPRMHGVIQAIGVSDYWDCRAGMDSNCASITPVEPVTTLALAGGYLAFFLGEGNVAVIRYQVGAVARE